MLRKLVIIVSVVESKSGALSDSQPQTIPTADTRFIIVIVLVPSKRRETISFDHQKPGIFTVSNGERVKRARHSLSQVCSIKNRDYSTYVCHICPLTLSDPYNP